MTNENQNRKKNENRGGRREKNINRDFTFLFCLNLERGDETTIANARSNWNSIGNRPVSFRYSEKLGDGETKNRSVGWDIWKMDVRRIMILFPTISPIG